MMGAYEFRGVDQILGLAPIFTPARAAQTLQSLGLGMTESTLRTRTEPIAEHLAPTFTPPELGEITRGRARLQRPSYDPDAAAPASARPWNRGAQHGNRI